MKLICSPHADSLPEPSSGVIPALLYGRSDVDKSASVGAAIIEDVRKAKLHPARRAWDFLSLSLAVATADLAVPRKRSSNGWTRELDLDIAVTEPDFWSAQSGRIQDMLRFLTTDIWNVRFIGGGYTFDPPKHADRPQEECVTLLSGGADSLIGAIDLITSGTRPFAVSQTVHGDGEKQTLFAQMFPGGLRHLKTNHNARYPGEGDGDQRARSMVFFAYGVLAASTVQRFDNGGNVVLYAPENGFISVNPPLTEARIGSLSTRTTHPVYVARLQNLLRAAELNITITNPYQFRSKGEMFQDCRDQELLKKMASVSTSCSRYERHGMQHCGRCVPCLIRRAAFHRWGQTDTTTYKYEDLSAPNGHHPSFDDVRCAAMAIAAAKADGVDSLLGATLASPLVDDVRPYRIVVERGLQELEVLFDVLGVT